MSKLTPAPDFDVRSRLAFLRRYFWLILAVTAISIGSAYWITDRQIPTYQASSTVLLRTNQTAALFPFSSVTRNELFRTPETELLFTEGSTYRDAVAPLTPANVSVTVRVVDSRSLLFAARSADPAAAAAAANDWAEQYVEMRRDAVLRENAEAALFIDEALAELEAERLEIRSDVVLLEELLERTFDADQYSRVLSQKVSLETQLQTQLAPVDTQIRDFTGQLANLDLVERYLADPDVSARLERSASVPSSPVSPDVTRNLLTAAALGLILGAGLAFVLQSLNDQVRTEDDVRLATGLSVLASIPKYKVDGDFPVESVVRPGSIASERYRSLVTALEFVSVKEPISSLLVTSPMPGEGKSTTAVNVAALAARHMNVLLIGADMRRPSLHRAVGETNMLGLSNLLLEKAEFDEVVRTVDLPDASLDLLPAGPQVPDPALLLRGDYWRSLIDKLVDRYDLVVIDGPPVLPVTDALLLGRDASAQLLVARAGETSQSELTKAHELLKSNGTRILGVVSNGEKLSRSGDAYRYDDAWQVDAADA